MTSALFQNTLHNGLLVFISVNIERGIDFFGTVFHDIDSQTFFVLHVVRKALAVITDQQMEFFANDV
jgi:hypothetical protein